MGAKIGLDVFGSENLWAESGKDDESPRFFICLCCFSIC
jgi:hypothetical protein